MRIIIDFQNINIVIVVVPENRENLLGQKSLIGSNKIDIIYT